VIPLSITEYTIRIFFTAGRPFYWLKKAALGFYHDVSGMLIFGLALLFLYCEACLFNSMDERK
jgi:hypothetical protein